LGPPVRILLVEDSAFDARLIDGLLSKCTTESFSVLRTDRLSAALERITAEPFHAVLLDLSLPDSDGLETFARLQALAQSVPIVILTSLDDEETARRGIAEGAQDYLLKGRVDRHILARAIRYAIERKHIEEEHHRLNAELDRRVSERTVELRAAVTELESFTYNVSHNLRAPLRHLDGFAHLLLQHAPPELDARCAHYVQAIGQCARKMGRLVDDLLAYTHVGRMPLSIQTVDLQAVVQAAQRDLAAVTEDRSISWSVAPLPLVEADPALLQRAVGNLLSNAIKFTTPQSAAHIEIGTLASDPGEIVVFVRDNGVGFDPRYAGKLFGVFQRLHSEEEFEGTGIGLAMVQRIILRHRGRVWGEGRIGEGATFYFALPTSLRA